MDNKDDIQRQSRRRSMANSKNTPVSMEMGKMPPQALDLEEAVLGAMMLEKDAVNAAIEILSPDSFYKDAHQKIFEAIKDLFGASEPIDILTVTNQLRQKGYLDMVGGPFYVSQLTNKVGSAANVEYHARIIAQKYIQRELINISSDIIKDAYDETTDVFDLLDKAERGIYEVAEGNIRKNYDEMKNIIQESIRQIEEAAKNVDGISGIPTGFNDLDRVTAGWQKSDLIILAARPAMGKTAFVLSMARNAAVDFGQPVAVFSLEMSSVQLVNRLISGEAEIEGEKLRKGSLEPHEFHQLHERIGKLSNAPIFIDDTPALSIFELRAKARRLKSQHDIQLIIIDYLQLMTASGAGGNREQEISTISRSLKGLAKELNVPVIALSQLSRAVETRGGDKRPQLSDLRESGAIEQDADLVSFIYRPEYYDITENEDGSSSRGIGEIIIAKHRNGALENVRLKFVGKYAKFTNLDTFEEYDGFAKNDSLAPNENFEGGSNVITMSSKMNDQANSIDDFDFNGPEDDSPF